MHEGRHQSDALLWSEAEDAAAVTKGTPGPDGALLRQRHSVAVACSVHITKTFLTAANSHASASYVKGRTSYRQAVVRTFAKT